jgi:hypothetical protein
MISPAKQVFIGLGTLLALIAIVVLLIFAIVRGSFPQTRGTLTAKGLNSPVEVLRDKYGVPHIRAATMHDLYFAQGYVTAQDRFWQMDFWRRIGAGRLSEIFGKATLGTDMYIRTVGFRRFAEQEYLTMDPDTKSIYDAYADGVNAYVVGKSPQKLGLEYTLLKVQGVTAAIEPWTPPDSLTWLKLMAQDLSTNMRRELYSIDLIQQVGLARTRDFFGTYRYGTCAAVVGRRFGRRLGRHKGRRERALLPGRAASRPSTRDSCGAQGCLPPGDRRHGSRCAPGHGRCAGTWLEQLGHRRVSHGFRKTHPCQRPAPGNPDALNLVPGGPVLLSAGGATGEDRRRPLPRERFFFRGDARHRHRP